MEISSAFGNMENLGHLIFFLTLSIIDCNGQKGVPSASIKDQNNGPAFQDNDNLLMAQTRYQEPPAFNHPSASYWNNHGAFDDPIGECKETRKDFDVARDHLNDVKETLLQRIGDDGECADNLNCTQIIISSVGRSLLRHPPRFGLYDLTTLYDDYPAFTRKASKQTFFYKTEYEKWFYAHKFERWVIGPTIGDENGGVVVLNGKKCPWKIDFGRSDVEVYFYDKLIYNHWNPMGNGWRMENGVNFIECYSPDKYPPIQCGCNVVNVSSDGGRISEYHPQKLGLYHIVPHTLKLGFLAPVYKKEGSKGVPDQYLYSHHHEGRLWLMGQSYTSWSIRLDLVSKFREEIIVEPIYDYGSMTTHGSLGPFCPTQQPPEGTVWEYLQGRNNEDEIWLKDANFRIHCIG